jgi:hypothetical protein
LSLTTGLAFVGYIANWLRPLRDKGAMEKQSGRHGTRTHNPLRGTTFPVGAGRSGSIECIDNGGKELRRERKAAEVPGDARVTVEPSTAGHYWPDDPDAGDGALEELQFVWPQLSRDLWLAIIAITNVVHLQRRDLDESDLGDDAVIPF